MEELSTFYCRILVNEDEIYSGRLGEVPEKFRSQMIRDLSEWSDSLGKRGLNELIYSHLAWYEEKGMHCTECGVRYTEGGAGECVECGNKLGERYVYERDKKLDMIITCVGMITKVQVSKI
jgi:hypothetical protein